MDLRFPAGATARGRNSGSCSSSYANYTGHWATVRDGNGRQPQIPPGGYSSNLWHPVPWQSWNDSIVEVRIAR